MTTTRYFPEQVLCKLGVNLDLDGDGVLVGFDIDNASKRFDLTELEAVSLPIAAE